METCINLEGAVTGYYYDAANGVHGFVRWRDGHFTEIDAPGASPAPFFGTLGSSINQEGTVAGYLVDSNNVAHGFVRTRAGDFTTIDDPVASTATGRARAFFRLTFSGRSPDCTRTRTVSCTASRVHRLARSLHSTLPTPELQTAKAPSPRPTMPKAMSSDGTSTATTFITASCGGRNF